MSTATVWIEAPAMGAEERAAFVSEALGPPRVMLHEPSGLTYEAWAVYPTESGTLLSVIYPETDLSPLLDRLASSFSDRDLDGLATSPPPYLDLYDRVWALGPQPLALLSYELSAPIQEAPVNMFGRPTYFWGVDPSLTRGILDDLATWTAHTGQRGVLHDVPLPLTQADATRVLRTRHAIDERRLQCSFASHGGPEQEQVLRSTSTDVWGQVGYTAADPGLNTRQLAEALTYKLTDNAAHLEFGCIRMGLPNSIVPQGGLWKLYRHLWSSRVPDAYGIQLLTDQHLDQAHDLSDWKIREVAPNRFLVQSRSLDDWYTPMTKAQWLTEALPDSQVRAQARLDFGDMILTETVAEANPLVMRTPGDPDLS